METQHVPRISAEQLQNWMGQGERVVVAVDVRTEDALNVHPYQIPETRWLPLAAVVQQADTLPRQGTIVTY